MNSVCAKNTCKTCGKQFLKPALLSRHEVVHSKQKPYLCVKCPSRFSQLSSLQRHTQQKHSIDSSIAIEESAAGIDEAEHVDVVARDALAALINLQSGMETTRSSLQQTNKNIKLQATLEEQPPCQIVQLRDRLHPSGESKAIATQLVQRQSKCVYYVCEFCAKEFPKTYDLIRHRRVHTKELPYICSLCVKRFTTQAKLNEHHNRLHAKLKRHSCSYCYASYSSSRLLHSHLAEQHSNLICECSNSNRTFYSTTAHFIHKKREADKELLSIQGLLPNPIEQSSLTLRTYKCVYCSRIFSRKFNCRLHMLTHIRRLLDEKPIEDADSRAKIKINVYKLVNLTKTKNHSSIDYELRPLPAKCCEHCGKNFQKPSDLLRHLGTHSGIKPHECCICQKEFTLKSTLQRHLNTHQTERSSVNCQVCGKLYSSKPALQLHLRLHTGERPFRCEICQQTFRTSGHKIEHMRVGKHENNVGLMG